MDSTSTPISADSTPETSSQVVQSMLVPSDPSSSMSNSAHLLASDPPPQNGHGAASPDATLTRSRRPATSHSSLSLSPLSPLSSPPPELDLDGQPPKLTAAQKGKGRASDLSSSGAPFKGKTAKRPEQQPARVARARRSTMGVGSGGIGGSAERKEIEELVWECRDRLANPTISDASSLPPLLLTTQSLSSLHPLVYIVEQAGIFEGADPPPRVAAAQKQAIIETPSFRIVPEEEEEAARSSLGRPKRHVEEPEETSDAHYNQLHKRYATFEIRQRRREKERLQHERYKMKERVDLIRVMDRRYFAALAVAGLAEDDPRRQVPPEEIRRKMLEEADAVLERYDQLLPVENRMKQRRFHLDDDSASDATPPPSSSSFAGCRRQSHHLHHHSITDVGPSSASTSALPPYSLQAPLTNGTSVNKLRIRLKLPPAVQARATMVSAPDQNIPVVAVPARPTKITLRRTPIFVDPNATVEIALPPDHEQKFSPHLKRASLDSVPGENPAASGDVVASPMKRSRRLSGASGTLPDDNAAGSYLPSTTNGRPARFRKVRRPREPDVPSSGDERDSSPPPPPTVADVVAIDDPVALPFALDPALALDPTLYAVDSPSAYYPRVAQPLLVIEALKQWLPSVEDDLTKSAEAVAPSAGKERRATRSERRRGALPWGVEVPAAVRWKSDFDLDGAAWLVLLKEREEVRAVEEEARVEAAAAISEMAWRPM